MFSSEAWLANPSSDFYNGVIDQSVRFEDGDSSNLYQSFSSGNQKTFTISFWMKRATISSYMNVFDVGSSGSSYCQTRFQNDDQLLIVSENGGGVVYNFETTQKFRDTTNWYHIVIAFDTTQSTESDRFKLYVNGSQVTAFDTATYPSLNTDTLINSSATHYIGKLAYAGQFYFDGYLAEYNFVDGTALAPTSFGETKNGVWIPKKISGLTYGTNGFRLTFADSSALGDDTSGGTNDFSVAGLASTDVVKDTPENNFSTWNSLFRGGEQSSSISASSTLSEGNLQVSVPTNSYMGNTFRPTSGKWYCEIYLKTRGSVNGEIDYGWLQATTYSGATAHGGVANKWGAYYHGYAAARYVLYDEASQLGSDITYEIAQGDVLQLAWDIDNAKGWIGVNNTWYRTNASDGNPSAGSNEAFSWTADEAQNLQVYVANGTSTDVHVANFGQDSTFAGSISASGNTDANGYPFKYTPPTGFLALCSANLPEPTISPNKSSQADDHFNTVLYTGNGSTTQNINIGFNPDWVWIKSRSSGSGHHSLVDSSRGDIALNSNQTIAEYSVDAFNFKTDNTIDVPYYANDYSMNTNTATYVAWNWKANGGTTTTNDASATGVGTIDSVYQANTTSGFSIVTWSGTGSAGTIAHGLGAVPKMIVVKTRDSSSNSWIVYHHEMGASPEDLRMFWDSNDASGTSTDNFNSTAPTSTVFSVGDISATNGGSNTYLAYCFAEVEGYSKFGSYASNNSSDGVFVHLGFRPAWLMIKLASASGEDWHMFDNKRATYNVMKARLIGNGTAQENTNDEIIDFLSNGFKLRDNNDGYNGSSKTYIYMAFAENPFKYSNAR